MTISGYAQGHIVASGPRQLGRDIRAIDTHLRPLYPTTKALTVRSHDLVVNASFQVLCHLLT
jgi:hypothetical protein